MGARAQAVIAIATAVMATSCGTGDGPSTNSTSSPSGPRAPTSITSAPTTVTPTTVTPTTVPAAPTSTADARSPAERLAGRDGNVFVIDLETVRVLTADEPFITPSTLDAAVLTGVVVVRGSSGRWDHQIGVTGLVGYPMQAVRVAQHVVISAVSNPTRSVDPVLWILDLTNDTWSTPTGIDPNTYRQGLGLEVIGDRVLVVGGDTAQVLSIETGRVGPSIDRPEPAAFFGTGSGVGVLTSSESVAIAVDNASGDGPYLTHPWAFDVAERTWRAVTWPSWLPRGDWPLQAPHEQGWLDFAAFVDGQVVACSTATDGFCGAWEPAANRWRRLDSPPTTLPGATPIVIGSKLEVIATTPCCNDIAESMSATVITSAVLDVPTGHWSPGALHIDIPNGASHVVTTADGAYAFLVTEDAPEPELAAVLDLRVARPAWRDATSSDRAALHIALGHATLTELGLS